MGPQAAVSLSERADALEHQMMEELNTIASKSALFKLAEGSREMDSPVALMAANPGKYMVMRDDPRLPKMPDKPTLLDFFNLRLFNLNHLLQSATHALKAGLDEKIILACLLHDIGVVGFIRC